jgi:hypothetical protein
MIQGKVLERSKVTVDLNNEGDYTCTITPPAELAQ